MVIKNIREIGNDKLCLTQPSCHHGILYNSPIGGWVLTLAVEVMRLDSGSSRYLGQFYHLVVEKVTNRWFSRFYKILN